MSGQSGRDKNSRPMSFYNLLSLMAKSVFSGSEDGTALKEEDTKADDTKVRSDMTVLPGGPISSDLEPERDFLVEDGNCIEANQWSSQDGLPSYSNPVVSKPKVVELSVKGNCDEGRQHPPSLSFTDSDEKDILLQSLKATAESKSLPVRDKSNHVTKSMTECARTSGGGDKCNNGDNDNDGVDGCGSGEDSDDVFLDVESYFSEEESSVLHSHGDDGTGMDKDSLGSGENVGDDHDADGDNKFENDSLDGDSVYSCDVNHPFDVTSIDELGEIPQVCSFYLDICLSSVNL